MAGRKARFSPRKSCQVAQPTFVTCTFSPLEGLPGCPAQFCYMYILAPWTVSRLPSPVLLQNTFLTSCFLACSSLPAAPSGKLPSLQSEVRQEEAICHTQSALAQIDPESVGDLSWISPQKRRFCEKAGRGGDQILAQKERVKEVIS